MTGRAAAARAVDWRLGAFFAAYFATVGVFAPYFPLYLESRGLTAAQIGIVLAMTQGMRVVGPNFWGYLADRTSHRVAILRATALATCACFAPILLTGGFGWVFAVMFAVNLFITAQIPVGESITAAYLRNDGSGASRYGRLRAWGSFGFVALVLAAGPLFDWAGIGWQPYVGLALLALLAATTFLVREPRHDESQHPAVSVRKRLGEPRVRWFLASAALMVFAHGAFYTYFSLYLAQLGYSKTQIGAFWVVGVVAEIVFFYTQGAFFARYGAFRLLAASFVLAALRFFLIAEFAHLWLLLLVAQLLHAASFAVHHSASILTIQHWFAGRAGARGQALYISVGYGVGGTAGSLAAAWLWSAFGPPAAFLSSSAAALAGWWAVQRTRTLDRAAHAHAAASTG
ncbi:MAG: MFS transporter [Burkholderiaceae bacterium]